MHDSLGTRLTSMEDLIGEFKRLERLASELSADSDSPPDQLKFVSWKRLLITDRIKSLRADAPDSCVTCQ